MKAKKKPKATDEKPPRPRSGSRFIDEQDVREFEIAAREFEAKVTASREAALATLIEFGIIESDGKLAKNYR